MVKNAESGFDAGALTTGKLVTFHKQPQSAKPDAASQRTELHSKQIYLFWKGVCKAECGASMLLAVNFLAQSLLACSKVTSPASPFMLGLNHQLVAAALCWYHSRKTSERLQRVPEQCHVLPAWQSPWQTCLPAAGSSQECCCSHVSIVPVSFATCLPVPHFLSWSYTRLGGQGADSERDKCLLCLLQKARTVSQLCCRVVMTGRPQWKSRTATEP